MNPKRRQALVACGVAAVVLQAGSARACQVCCAIMTYDLLRFGVVWFYLLPVWTAITLVADWQRTRKLHFETAPALLFSKGPLVLLLAVIPLLSAAGLHFFALLYFSVLLIPHCAKASWLHKPSSMQQARFAPGWLKGAGKAMAVALILLGIPTYFVFPIMFTESHTRFRVSLVRGNMKSMGAFLEKHQQRFHAFPPELIEEHDGETFYVVDASALRRANPDVSEKRLSALSRDPFKYRWRSLPRVAELAAFFPYSVLQERRWRRAIEFDRSIFDRIQYRTTDSGYVLWSRGPDAHFHPGLYEILTVKTSDSTTVTAARANLTYDPTNGMFSPGDIYVRVPDT